MKIKSISNAYADVVLDDGQTLHVAAKPHALTLLSHLARNAPIESFFDAHVMDDQVQESDKEKKAVFRLGQLDMKFSILDILRAAANNAADESRTGLIVAANMVESMEVPHADT